MGAALTKWNISSDKYGSFSRFHLSTQKRSKMKVTIGIPDGTWFAILDTCSDLIWNQGYECTRLNVVFVFLFLFRFSLSVFMRCFKRTIGENSTFILIFKFCLINTVSLFPEGVLLHIKQLY